MGNELGVSIERDSISVLEETSPASNSVEAIVCGEEGKREIRVRFSNEDATKKLTNGDPRSFPFSDTSDTTNDVIDLSVAERR